MGTNIVDNTLETLEEGAASVVKGAGQQINLAGQAAVNSVTGSGNMSVKPPTPNTPEGAGQQSGTNPQNTDNQDFVKALYGSSQQPNGQPQQPANQMQAQSNQQDQEQLLKARKLLQEQHNKVYFDKLLHPEAGRREETVQEKLEKEKQEEEQKKQIKLEEEEKKQQVVKAPPSKESAERERRLGG
ncbi:MAG TPA: hypothetical protein VMR41_04195 [Patescibacteria group bacterium]|nr:hypothetical protein [Patescibacteria group bacterium]